MSLAILKEPVELQVESQLVYHLHRALPKMARLGASKSGALHLKRVCLGKPVSVATVR